MNEKVHEKIQEALGAYALNATDDVERRQIERHLSECDDCANEVRMLKEAASELAWLVPAEEAGDLPERISKSLPLRGGRRTTPILAAIAAAAVAVAGFLGAGFVRERSVNAELADILAASSRRVPLSPQGGFPARGVLYVASGKAALVLEELPDAGKDRTYQLWAVTGAEPHSMTVVDGTGRVVLLFDWEGRRADRFAVTIEPQGGSPVPTTDPVLVGA
jgi:anti-sigma factor RsiW